MWQQRRVLVVDDERDLVDLLALNLRKEGHGVSTALDGREGLAKAREQRPDLAIIDVMMPEMDGVELVKRLRADPRTASMPIVMLTAKTAEQDELAALSIGADDYVAKPFSMKILLARVRSLLRRSYDQPPEADERVRLGEIAVDLQRHEATVRGEKLRLTRTEFRILAALLGADGRVLSRAHLIGRAIGVGVSVTKRTVDVHVTSLRRKLGDQAHLIKTVRGVGYRATEAEGERPEADG